MKFGANLLPKLLLWAPLSNVAGDRRQITECSAVSFVSERLVIAAATIVNPSPLQIDRTTKDGM